MTDTDTLILNHIANDFKTVREISKDLNLPYVRVAVRLKQLRRGKFVISIQTNELHIRGVKPLKYKKRSD